MKALTYSKYNLESDMQETESSSVNCSRELLGIKKILYPSIWYNPASIPTTLTCNHRVDEPINSIQLLIPANQQA